MKGSVTKYFIRLAFLVLSCSTLLLLFRLWMSDQYHMRDRFPPSRLKSTFKLNIMMVMVIENKENAERDYSTALNSIRCYSKMHDYKFSLVEEYEYRHVCQQRDFMFRRHCIVANLLHEAEWIFFLDADVAVVNPNVLLEDYISPQYDITMYDRFLNWEVAAGSYIVRNTEWAKDFLQKFANFENSLPNSFHGTDNGALHVFLQQTFYPELSEESRVCLKVWEEADSFQDLFTFEACIRTVMGDVHEFSKARILKKGTGWVRDIWLADSKWSPERDFMLHGLKDSHQISLGQGLIVNTLFGKFNWRSPLKKKLDLDDCKSPEKTLWEYNPQLIVTHEIIENYLSDRFVEVEKRRWISLSDIAEYVT